MNLKKPDGKTPFFAVVDCLQICAKCMKLDRVKSIKCTHVKSSAHWLSSRKIQELKALYNTRPEDAIREFGKYLYTYFYCLRNFQKAESSFRTTNPLCEKRKCKIVLKCNRLFHSSHLQLFSRVVIRPEAAPVIWPLFLVTLQNWEM